MLRASTVLLSIVKLLVLYNDDVTILLLKSAVAGSPHPIKGQEIKAFFVLTLDIAATGELADKIFTYCKAHLAPCKVPQLLKFVAELPKTISGKSQWIELRTAQGQQQALEAIQPQEYYL